MNADKFTAFHVIDNSRKNIQLKSFSLALLREKNRAQFSPMNSQLLDSVAKSSTSTLPSSTRKGCKPSAG